MPKQLSLKEYAQASREADVYQAAIRTPLVEAPRLSAKLETQILLKREDTQPVFSFKVRGAANAIFSASIDAIAKGVICSSAGNHAQGVALAAANRGVPAHIVMPKTAAQIKIDAVEELGGTVTLAGQTFDECQAHAAQLAKEKGMLFIHPFDDPLVIAGQGTIGVEIIEENPDVGAVYIPIGGGGLAAGIASYIRSTKPGVKLVGVEPEDTASMTAAFDNGTPVTLDQIGIFADGVAVSRVGDETYRLCQEALDEIITVNTDEICAAIQLIYEDTRTVVEPAGAIAVAGIAKQKSQDKLSGGPIAAIVCGANMNFDRLRHVTERSAIGQGTEALFSVTIPERKGSFLNLINYLVDYNVTEFNYRMSERDNANVFLGVDLNRNGEVSSSAEIGAHLDSAGFDNQDLTNSEVAKLHIRHLAAGSGSAEDERLFRFMFPERKGALRNFLSAIGTEWNISLFHYRNHGSDYGRVLCGIQVPPESASELMSHLNDLGYSYTDETDDPTYKLFLSNS